VLTGCRVGYLMRRCDQVLRRERWQQLLLSRQITSTDSARLTRIWNDWHALGLCTA